MASESASGDLKSWDEILGKVDATEGLLLGNGASMVVWPKFGYSSLFEQARQPGATRLGPDDVALFQSFGTTNFELVLSRLAAARRVNSALGLPTAPVDERYTSIRQALGKAVRDVHVPHDLVSDEIFNKLRDEYSEYASVFTTNYDLLPYWAINHGGAGSQFKDFFWPDFDLADVTVREYPTLLYYLHGGLHLRRTADGGTRKIYGGFDGGILAQFGLDDEEEIPLFIAEGSAESKQASIGSSDYLGFAYQSLRNFEGDLVIFGSSLGESDDHIAKAINAAPGIERVAVSIRPNSPEAVRKRKGEIQKQLPKKRLYYFDAATHPLGAEELRIPEPPPPLPDPW